MNKTLKQVLEPELNPAPVQPQFKREKSNAEILKNVIEMFKKGGDENGK